MVAAAVRMIIAALLVGPLAGCAPSPYSEPDGNAFDRSDAANADSGATSCQSLFESVMASVRNGDTDSAINTELDALGDRCLDRYQVFVDYMSVRGFADLDPNGSCSDYVNSGVGEEAVRLARGDGLCSGGQSSVGGSRVWRCSYSPTYNDDWHDDVVCSNGEEEERPYLREWDNFITEAELMESARQFEAQLNRG